MNIKKKLRTGTAIFKDRGFLGVSAVGIEYLQKRARRRPNSKNKFEIDTSARYEEVLSVDFDKPANALWKAPKKRKDSLTINWLMPPPGKGSGGHMTLFRFIKYFELAGHTCRLYFHRPGPGSTVEAVRDAMGDGFPKIKASMEWLPDGKEMAEADAVFATSWQTAYTVYGSKISAKKFYFVQDYEPFFYPIGGFYYLSENTYRMGLRGITAGGWLEKKLHDDFGMITTKFDFGSDSKTYTYTNANNRNEVIFYARPTTPRRAFEFGIAALDIFHQKHPEYTINFIGWDVSDFKIPFPFKNLGILNHSELNHLYNKCAVSLVMSLTNMSLLPLELLSSGCIPVVNDGPNNRLVSDNPFIAYAPTNPRALADAMSKVVEIKNLPEHAKKASESVSDCEWDKSGEKVVETVIKSFMTDGEG